MNIISKWLDKIAQYLNVRIRSIQLTIVERTAALLSYFIFALIMLFFGFAILFFSGFGLAEVFIKLLDSRMGGFFLTVGAYAFFMLLVYLLRKPILKGFASVFIKIMTTDEDEDEHGNEKDSII
ncbi:MAG: hypothetical protein ACTHJ0_09425 [Flavipsychrobacter sp.]